jgi:hypothetical protein
MVARKPAPRITIRLVNVRTGDYRVLSSDGRRWYAVNVARVTCTCAAGQDNFARCVHVPYCRHMRVAKMLARVIHDRAVAAKQAAAA